MTSERHAREQSRLVWPPTPGFFAIALVRGGWAVPARIVRMSEGHWYAIINGVAYESHGDPLYAPMVARIWHSGLKITPAEYDHRLAIRAWAEVHDPDHPALKPMRPIHPAQLRPIPPTRTPLS